MRRGNRQAVSNVPKRQAELSGKTSRCGAELAEERVVHVDREQRKRRCLESAVCCVHAHVLQMTERRKAIGPSDGRG